MKKGLNAYKKVNVESKVASASPKELVSLLYEGIVKNVSLAKKYMEAGDISKKGERISKAIDIVNHLISTLNMEKGGEVAENMLSVYDYCNRLLLEGNLNNSSEGLDEVIKLITELKEGWDSI